MVSLLERSLLPDAPAPALPHSFFQRVVSCVCVSLDELCDSLESWLVKFSGSGVKFRGGERERERLGSDTVASFANAPWKKTALVPETAVQKLSTKTRGCVSRRALCVSQDARLSRDGIARVSLRAFSFFTDSYIKGPSESLFDLVTRRSVCLTRATFATRVLAQRSRSSQKSRDRSLSLSLSSKFNSG